METISYKVIAIDPVTNQVTLSIEVDKIMGFKQEIRVNSLVKSELIEELDNYVLSLSDELVKEEDTSEESTNEVDLLLKELGTERVLNVKERRNKTK